MEIQYPEIIDITHPERYIFTLKVDPVNFSFSLYEPVVDSSFFYYELPIEKNIDAISSFKQFFFENPFLASSFRKAYVINANSEFTFVPEFLYKENQAEAFVGFNFSDSSGKVLDQKIRYPEMIILHKMQEEAYQFLSRSLTNTQYIHYTSPLISYFLMKSKNMKSSQLFVNMWNNRLDILCFSQGNFVLANSFNVSNLHDAVYYILFVWKQLKLDQIRDYIYIFAKKHEIVNLIKEIQHYIHNVVPINFPSTAHFSGVDLQNIPIEFSTLTLCEI